MQPRANRRKLSNASIVALDSHYVQQDLGMKKQLIHVKARASNVNRVSVLSSERTLWTGTSCSVHVHQSHHNKVTNHSAVQDATRYSKANSI